MSGQDEERTARTRIAVVDDHEMFRAGVIATLTPYFDVVGQAADVESSVMMIADTKPDVVLLDVHVPGGNGGGGAEILTTSQPLSPSSAFLALSVSDSAQDVGAVIRAGARGYVTKTITGNELIHSTSQPLSPSSAFLALSVSDSAQDVGAVIRAGARGYVTKTITGNELIHSIEQVADGYAVFSPKLAGFVLSAFQGAPAGANGADEEVHDDELDRLSTREQEVMRLIARGYTYKEAAAELFISVKTVETHVSSVLRKLQLSNRNELTLWAADRHIV